jgi:hypothetical protein
MSNRSDTSVDAEQFRTAFLQSLSGEQRVSMAVEMTHSAHEITKRGISARHPEYSNEEVHVAFVRLLLGDELFGAANPGLPLLAP